MTLRGYQSTSIETGLAGTTSYPLGPRAPYSRSAHLLSPPAGEPLQRLGGAPVGLALGLEGQKRSDRIPDSRARRGMAGVR
jgi:hypothetical protein